MRILKWLLLALLTLGTMLVLAGQLGLLAGSPPTDLGVRAGRLKAPSLTENSVSSQAALHPGAPQRAYAQIGALALRGDGPATMARLQAIVEATPGARVVKSEPDYLYAQYTSRVMKFVDDVEFWFDPATQAVQVRSASRIGRRDRGVNRERIEALRAALAAAP